MPQQLMPELGPSPQVQGALSVAPVQVWWLAHTWLEEPASRTPASDVEVHCEASPVEQVSKALWVKQL